MALATYHPPFFKLPSIFPPQVSTLLLGMILYGLLATHYAHAQYMYFDSNGDGVHTAADVITGTGTTNFDVWLRTDKHRDGSTATCDTHDGLLEIGSYEVSIRATGGTVSWISATNLMTTMGLSFGNKGSSTEYYIGYAGSGFLPAGDYRLCRLSLTVASGEPRLDIVAGTTVNPFGLTAFGSRCSGNSGTNTMIFGDDWFDVDGLAFSSSGGGNSAPALSGPTTLSVNTGELGTANFVATDAEGDPIALLLGAAPSFVRLTTSVQQSHDLPFSIGVLPLRGDTGHYDVRIDLSDGVLSTTATLQIDVRDGPDHPPSLRRIDPIRMVAGAAAAAGIEAADFDGDPILFHLSGEPAFALVTTLVSGRSATTGRLWLRPGVCDVGVYDLEVQAVARDGESRVHVQVAVVAGAETPSPSVRQFPGNPDGLATGDFNEDGNADVATVSDSPSALQIWLGDGSGNLTSSFQETIGRAYVALESADWNGDGHIDLAAGAFTASPLAIFWGRGDGTFSDPTIYADVSSVNEIRSADLNGDGIADLAASNETENIYVLLGSATSAPGPVRRLPVGSLSNDLAIEDFDRDGRLDLAVAAFEEVRILYGLGDGTFGSERSFATGRGPFGLVAGDWDEDGVLDLAAMRSYTDGQFILMKGDPSGGFSPATPGVTLGYGSEIAAGDWNGDGHLDLYPTGDFNARLLIGSGHGSFVASAPMTVPAGLNDALFTDLNADGRPDLVLSDNLRTILNTTPSVPQANARSFVDQTNRPISTVSSAKPLCVRVEPVGGAFVPSDTDLSSLRLSSSGTGSVSEIAAVSGKTAVIIDSDDNGVQEYPAYFAMSDVSRLFSLLNGKTDVTASLTGRLVDGRRICSKVALTILGTGHGAIATRVEPNPLNPEGVLRFTTKIAGAVSVRLFDVNGRLVRSIWNARSTAAGDQEVRIDGRDGGGRSLRSGVYFYRIEGADLSETGRFTVLK